MEKKIIKEEAERSHWEEEEEEGEGDEVEGGGTEGHTASTLTPSALVQSLGREHKDETKEHNKYLTTP